MGYRNQIVEIVEKTCNRQKYDETMGQRVMEMAQEGKFPEEWCAEIGILPSTLYNWANRYPEFEEAVENAWVLLHAWAAKTFRENLQNPNFRQTMFLKKMERRLPNTFGDKAKLTEDNFLRFFQTGQGLPGGK